MPISQVNAILLTLASALVMLTIWGFSSRDTSRLRTMLKQAPIALGIFALAWLVERLFGSVASPWLAIILLAPLFEELARFVFTDLLELKEQHEGLFFGIIIGIAETIILLAEMKISDAALLFRILFSQPLHATQGMSMVQRQKSLPANILIHFLFNYGIFVGGLPGMLIATSALMGNVVRLIFSETISNHRPA